MKLNKVNENCFASCVVTYVSVKTPACTDDSRFIFCRWNFSKSSPPPVFPPEILQFITPVAFKLLEMRNTNQLVFIFITVKDWIQLKITKYEEKIYVKKFHRCFKLKTTACQLKINCDKFKLLIYVFVILFW